MKKEITIKTKELRALAYWARFGIERCVAGSFMEEAIAAMETYESDLQNLYSKKPIRPGSAGLTDVAVTMITQLQLSIAKLRRDPLYELIEESSPSLPT